MSRTLLPILVPLAVLVLPAASHAQEPGFRGQDPVAEDHVWTSDRPDGIAPIGVVADGTVPAGTLAWTYRFSKIDAEGLQLGTDLVTFGEAEDIFDVIPLDRSQETHLLTVGYGVTGDLTVLASGGWITKTRTQTTADFDQDGLVFFAETSDLADVQVDLLYDVWERGAYRANVQLGTVIPVGSVEERGELVGSTSTQLPYDMQIGGGSWALVPGVTVQTQNAVGSVGLQVLGVLRLNDNDRGYRLGDEVEASAWTAYMINDIFAVTARVRAMSRGAIDGFDPELETFRDPGDLSLSFAATRVDLPVGLNIRLPSGPLAGHRFGVEFVWTVHEDTDGVMLSTDSGFILGWQWGVGLGDLF